MLDPDTVPLEEVVELGGPKRLLSPRQRASLRRHP
jgi:hypothetical protein